MLYKWGILALLALWVPSQAMAQDAWTLSGFASIGAGRLADDNLEYLDYTSGRWSFEGDSVFGLQLDLNLADRLSLVSQVVSRGYNQDDTSEFEPELDWFFLRYQLDNAWRARIGRMRTPLYLYSETIDVGYSYVWVRPPTDVYAPIASPFSNFDGADLVYLSELGDYNLDIQLLTGRMKRSRNDLEISVDPLLGGNLTLQNQNLTLRYALMMLCTDVTWSNLEQLEDYYHVAGPLVSLYAGQDLTGVFEEIAKGFSAVDNWYIYQTLGLKWTTGNVTTTGEFFRLENTDDGYTNNATGAYLSLQYNFKQFTPYLVAGYYHNEFGQDALRAVNESYSAWPAHQSIPLFQLQVDQLDLLREQTVDFIDSLNYKQQTWTLGVRYDVYRNIALKAEWQYFDILQGRGGQLVWTDTDVTDHTSLTTLTLDVVF